MYVLIVKKFVTLRRFLSFFKIMEKNISNKKFFGTICGILAAVFYGTNPLGALKLYEQGMNTN